MNGIQSHLEIFVDDADLDILYDEVEFKCLDLIWMEACDLTSHLTTVLN